MTSYDPIPSQLPTSSKSRRAGSNSVVKVDRGGTGGSYSLAQIATIEGVTGLTNEATLLANGHIIAA